MITYRERLLLFVLVVTLSSLLVFNAMAQETANPSAQSSPSDQSPQKLVMGKAVMCEKVENLKPVRTAIAFPSSLGQLCCFTFFESVAEPTSVYHKWYHNGQLSTQIRLRLYPPKWTTYSVIQLRETDKGPWYVEITDINGRVLNVLRFSITD